MQVQALINLLSRMPPKARVYFKDYGSDQDKWCAITKVTSPIGRPYLLLAMKKNGRSRQLDK